MNNILVWLSWLVTARPWLALLVLLIVTVLLAMGSGLHEPPLDTEGTLPGTAPSPKRWLRSTSSSGTPARSE